MILMFKNKKTYFNQWQITFMVGGASCCLFGTTRKSGGQTEPNKFPFPFPFPFPHAQKLAKASISSF